MKALWDYQREDVDRFKSEGHKAGFIAYDMALGKTLTSTTLTMELGCERVLVIGPRITFSSWKKAVYSQSDGAIELRRLKKTGKANRQALQDFYDQKPGWYFITWELMRNGTINDREDQVGDAVEMIIADEVHAIQNKGKSAQNVLIDNISTEYKLGLSGTPSANRPTSIYGVISWLWPKRYKSYWNWVEEHFLLRFVGSSPDIIREKKAGSVVNDLPFFVRRLKEDHDVGIPEPLPMETVMIELTDYQKELYANLRDESGVWLGDELMTTEFSIVKANRLRQLCLGVPTMTYDPDTGKEVISFDQGTESSAIEALVGILQQSDMAGEAVTVYTHSKAIMDAVVYQLGKAGIRARKLNGDTKDSVREDLIGELGDTYDVLVGSIAAMGTGLDGLQEVCSRVVYLSQHANHMLNVQARDRVVRPGQTEQVKFYQIVAKGTVDEDDVKNSEITQAVLDRFLDSTDETW